MMKMINSNLGYPQSDDSIEVVASDVKPGAWVDKGGIPALEYVVGVGEPFSQSK